PAPPRNGRHRPRQGRRLPPAPRAVARRLGNPPLRDPGARGAALRSAGEGSGVRRDVVHRSEGRILVTHVGSFPRPPRLRELLVRQERGEAVDPADLAREIDAAVGAVVGKQLDAGIDIGNDGEQPRVGFSTYVARRMRGFGGESRRPPARDLVDFPDYADLAMEPTRLFQHEPLERFLQIVEAHVEAINRATAKIPADRIRLHVCWGNYDGPHTSDVPLEAILPLVYRARVGALSLELA